jgi:hypothetical protein
VFRFRLISPQRPAPEEYRSIVRTSPPVQGQVPVLQNPSTARSPSQTINIRSIRHPSRETSNLNPVRVPESIVSLMRSSRGEERDHSASMII